MNKKEKFIETIKNQLNVELENDKDCIWNKKRNILYTRITRENKLDVINYLVKHNIVFNEHIKDYYWIYV
jgi:hypothetical protein